MYDLNSSIKRNHYSENEISLEGTKIAKPLTFGEGTFRETPPKTKDFMEQPVSNVHTHIDFKGIS